jgi:hypothetical protein
MGITMKKNKKPTHFVAASNGSTTTSQGAYGMKDLYTLISYLQKDGYTYITIKILPK